MGTSAYYLQGRPTSNKSHTYSAPQRLQANRKNISPISQMNLLWLYFNMENNMTCMIYQPQLKVLNDNTTRQWYFKIKWLLLRSWILGSSHNTELQISQTNSRCRLTCTIIMRNKKWNANYSITTKITFGPNQTYRVFQIIFFHR